MSEDISLLPEGMRKNEDAMKKTEPAKADSGASELRFSTPLNEEEDIETIEIDEGEVEQVLASEPFLTRLAFKTSEFFEGLKSKLLHPGEPEPPPKLPPQFFAPPPAKPKPVLTPAAPALTPSGSAPSSSAVAAGTSTPTPSAASTGASTAFSTVPAKPAATPAQAGASLLASSVAAPGSPPSPAAAGAAAKPKARIIPAEKTPRRVRVIKRVRKPVRVSFVSEEDLRLLHVDISKRKFTLAILTLLFVASIGVGVFALGQQQAAADAELAAAKTQSADVLSVTAEKQKEWSNFQDLQPRLKALIGLLNQHMSPTHLLASLEKTTLKDVQYGSFSLTPDQRVSLPVITDSYESAARQIVAFQHASFVKSVDASGFTALYDSKNPLLPKSVTFQVTLTLSPSALQ